MEPWEQVGIAAAALGGGALAAAVILPPPITKPTPPSLWTALVASAAIGFVTWALEKDGSPAEQRAWRLVELAGLGAATTYFEGWSLRQAAALGASSTTAALPPVATSG
jgi:hypothetical protein